MVGSGGGDWVPGHLAFGAVVAAIVGALHALGVL